MANMKPIDWIAIVLLIAGGINWGLIGLFNYNLVETLLGNLSKWIYILVGAAGVYSIFSLSRINK